MLTHMSRCPSRRATTGKYLANAVKESDELELSFVWNRSAEKIRGELDDALILENLDDFAERFVVSVAAVRAPSPTQESSCSAKRGSC